MVARLSELFLAQAIRDYVEQLPESSGGWLRGLTKFTSYITDDLTLTALYGKSKLTYYNEPPATGVTGPFIGNVSQQNPAALAAYYKAEVDKWAPIIKAANIKLQ